MWAFLRRLIVHLCVTATQLVTTLGAGVGDIEGLRNLGLESKLGRYEEHQDDPRT
jgi:hypothetical protein